MYIITEINPDGDSKVSVPTLEQLTKLIKETNWKGTFRLIIEYRE